MIDPLVLKGAAGLGLLFGSLSFLEDRLERLGGSAFSRYLRSSTKTPLRGVFSGTIATGILQSSSLVMLVMLTLVGANVIPLSNALGVVLGSNLGTTFTGWIVAAIGFKVDSATFSYLLLSIGGAGSIVFSTWRKLRVALEATLSVGLLLLSLSLIREVMSSLEQYVDLASFQGPPLLVYAAVGLVITAIIQSSSAMMMITLAALNAEILSLSQAAAIVIGADLGTTGTSILGALGAGPARKRLALAHVLFNVVTDGIALLALPWLLDLTLHLFAEGEVLYRLVLFHSSFNFLGIIIFLPFVGVWGRFLEQRFVSADNRISVYLSSARAEVPDAAIAALAAEAKCFLARVIRTNAAGLNISEFALPDEDPDTFLDCYRLLGEHQAELLQFAIAVERNQLSEHESKRLHALIELISHGGNSAKSIKDIHHNIDDLGMTPGDEIRSFRKHVRDYMVRTYKTLQQELETLVAQSERDRLMEVNSATYETTRETIFNLIDDRLLERASIPALMNINRELYSSNKELLRAVSLHQQLASDATVEMGTVPIS